MLERRSGRDRPSGGPSPRRPGDRRRASSSLSRSRRVERHACDSRLARREARCARAARRARQAAGSGGPGSPRPPSRPPVAEDEGVRRRAVDEPERHARVQRVHERALPLDEEELAAACGLPRRRGARPRRRGSRRRQRRRRSPTRRSRCPSAPSGRRPSASPRRRASRSSSTATVFFPIAQSEPTVRTIFASTSRFAPVGTFRPSGGLRRSRSVDAARSGELGELGIVGDELVEPILDVEPGSDAAFRRSRQAGGKRPPCVATPTTATVGS